MSAEPELNPDEDLDRIMTNLRLERASRYKDGHTLYVCHGILTQPQVHDVMKGFLSYCKDSASTDEFGLNKYINEINGCTYVLNYVLLNGGVQCSPPLSYIRFSSKKVFNLAMGYSIDGSQRYIDVEKYTTVDYKEPPPLVSLQEFVKQEKLNMISKKPKGLTKKSWAYQSSSEDEDEDYDSDASEYEDKEYGEQLKIEKLERKKYIEEFNSRPNLLNKMVEEQGPDKKIIVKYNKLIENAYNERHRLVKEETKPIINRLCDFKILLTDEQAAKVLSDCLSSAKIEMESGSRIDKVFGSDFEAYKMDKVATYDKMGSLMIRPCYTHERPVNAELNKLIGIVRNTNKKWLTASLVKSYFQTYTTDFSLEGNTTRMLFPQCTVKEKDKNMIIQIVFSNKADSKYDADFCLHMMKKTKIFNPSNPLEFIETLLSFAHANSENDSHYKSKGDLRSDTRNNGGRGRGKDNRSGGRGRGRGRGGEGEESDKPIDEDDKFLGSNYSFNRTENPWERIRINTSPKEQSRSIDRSRYPSERGDSRNIERSRYANDETSETSSVTSRPSPVPKVRAELGSTISDPSKRWATIGLSKLNDGKKEEKKSIDRRSSSPTLINTDLKKVLPPSIKKKQESTPSLKEVPKSFGIKLLTYSFSGIPRENYKNVVVEFAKSIPLKPIIVNHDEQPARVINSGKSSKGLPPAIIKKAEETVEQEERKETKEERAERKKAKEERKKEKELKKAKLLEEIDGFEEVKVKTKKPKEVTVTITEKNRDISPIKSRGSSKPVSMKLTNKSIYDFSESEESD